MERRAEDVALADENDVAVAAAKHVDACSRALDPGRANEHGRKRFLAKRRYREIDFGGGDLTSEGVTAHRNVDEIERRLRQIGHVVRGDNQSHAGAPQRHSRVHSIFYGRRKSEALEQLDDRRRFTTGNDECVDASEIFGSFDFQRRRAGALEGSDMLGDVPLQCEDADTWFFLQTPRTDMSCSCGIVRMSSPCIAPAPAIWSCASIT